MKDGWIKVAAATPRVKVADPRYNAAQIRLQIEEAARQGVQILVFPELSLTGYTCGDLFLQETLLNAVEEELTALAGAVGDMLVAVGAPLRCRHKLYNSAVLMSQGQILGVVPKRYLPNYSEFYEMRHFTAGEPAMGSIRIGELTVPFAIARMPNHAAAGRGRRDLRRSVGAGAAQPKPCAGGRYGDYEFIGQR